MVATDYLDIAIDTSDAQYARGPVDWPAVAASGIRVAFIKATEGHTFAAHNFVRARDQAHAAGLTVIPYDFLRPGYEQATIDFFVKTAGLAKGSLCMIDWEGRASDTCTPQEAEDIVKALRDLTGRLPVGYWGEDGSTPEPPTALMRTCPRFVPRYPFRNIGKFADESTAIRANPLHWWPGALFAQYTPTGKVPGIVGPVDRSIWIGTQAELDAWLKDGTMPARLQPVAHAT